MAALLHRPEGEGGLVERKAVADHRLEAEPDPEHHRYLLPLTPDRLRNTWLGVVVTLIGWGTADRLFDHYLGVSA